MTRPAIVLAVVAALLAPGAASAGWRARRGLALEGALSRFPQDPRVAAGGAFSARLAFAETVLAVDVAARTPHGEAGFSWSGLLGAGLAADVSPLVSAHAHAVVGTYEVQLRDYVHGGWRSVSGEGAWGGRLGIRLHPPARFPRGGRVGLWPIAGLWVTVLRVDPGADRLRDAEWGGTLAVLTLSLGAELTGPARHVLPQR